MFRWYIVVSLSVKDDLMKSMKDICDMYDYAFLLLLYSPIFSCLFIFTVLYHGEFHWLLFLLFYLPKIGHREN